jgi:type IV secretion system protein VirB5
MKNSKCTLKKIITGMIFVIYLPCHAQITVNTPSLDMITIQNQIANMAQLVNEYNQMVALYGQAQTTYKSISGIRNFHELLANPYVRQFVPIKTLETYQQATDIQKCVTNNLAGNIGRCQISNVNFAKTTIAGQISASLAKRRNEVQSMVYQLAYTSDPKAVQDLNARINAEKANIATEQADYENTLLQIQLTDEAQKIKLQDDYWVSVTKFQTPIPNANIAPPKFNNGGSNIQLSNYNLGTN